MAKAYSLIQAQTLTGTTASVTFSNIPQSFTDLQILVSARSDYAGAGEPSLYVSPNGVAQSSMTFKNLFSLQGGSPASNSSTNGYNGWVSKSIYTANTFSNIICYLPNYSSTSVYKSFSFESVNENNGSSASSSISAVLYSSNSAITSLTLTTDSNFVSGSTFYLYGIGGTRATGGTITSDANYTYHTFTSTGTFTALEQIKNAEVLLVAGGGGGGRENYYTGCGGGGGAGGVLYTPGQNLTAGTSYSAIVGSGGAAAASAGAQGSDGGNSQFGSLTGIGGGGGGGGSNNANGRNGGSGGGAASDATRTTPGTGTAGQGNNGGQGTVTPNSSAGGGGGAGGIGGGGSTAGNGIGGYGGVGSSSYNYWHLATATGVSVSGIYFIAGGGAGAGGSSSATGAGGAGGAGGGGTGATYNSGGATAGTANTGGGGGGGQNGTGTGAAGAGGSGLVIVRYPNI